MYTPALDLLYANKFCSFSVNYEKEIQKFFEDFQKKIEKAKMKKKLQSKILKWLSELKSEDQKRICTIQNKYLSQIFSQINSLYRKDNNIKFEPTGDMKLLFEGHSPKIEKKDKNKEEEKKEKENSQNSLNLLNREEFSSNDESYSSNKKEYGENNIINMFEGENKGLVNYFSIVKSDKETKDDKNKNEMRIKTEKSFLKYINRISSDEFLITISDELLSDFEKFKNFFLYFSNDKCFKDWLFPKEKNGNKYFTLSSWISINNKYFTICEIYIAFFEQRILFFYEYYLYTNRIYKPKYENNKIIELYDEIDTKVGQLTNDSNYFGKIFSQGIINDICKKNNINNDFSLNIFHELKNSINDINNEKEKIIKLLKMLTFLNFDNFNNHKILFYNSYKKYILDFLENEITQELIMEDKKYQIYKTNKIQNKKNNNKKDKNKLNKRELIDNKNIKKEEEKIENRVEKNENEKNEKNNREENVKSKNNKNEIRENKNKDVDEKKSKKNK